MHDLLVELEPDLLVIEVCGIAGWIHDLATSLGIAVEVANPQHEGWRWNRVKRKTDRGDALKLARLSAIQQLPTVYIPLRRTRQWKSLIALPAHVDRSTHCNQEHDPRADRYVRAPNTGGGARLDAGVTSPEYA
jgi:hypothetical protein